jgi:hypothetical protein
MYDGNSTGWKLWALMKKADTHVNRFNGLVRGTNHSLSKRPLEKDSWYRWCTECGARPFIMKCFTGKEAKGLRSVMITTIHSILFDLL